MAPHSRECLNLVVRSISGLSNRGAAHLLHKEIIAPFVSAIYQLQQDGMSTADTIWSAKRAMCSWAAASPEPALAPWPSYQQEPNYQQPAILAQPAAMTQPRTSSSSMYHQRHSRHKRSLQATYEGLNVGMAAQALQTSNNNSSQQDAAQVAGPAVAIAAVPTPVKITASGVAIPHPEKVLKNKTKGRNTQGFGYGGEDAYFFARNRNGLFGMGVADGVYMWREQGIDSGLMSRALMESCRQQVQDGQDDVVAMLNKAVTGIQEAQLQGSTTLCVLTINQNTGLLRAANLGDSGFFVLGPSGKHKGYDVKFKSNQLEHSFGCPFQIGHHASANKVEESEVVALHVQPADVLIMGSDGLLDNLADIELSQEVTSMMAQGFSTSQMAQRITHLAFEASIDKRRSTPYSLEASAAFDMVYSGGKPDDITVLVALCS